VTLPPADKKKMLLDRIRQVEHEAYLNTIDRIVTESLLGTSVGTEALRKATEAHNKADQFSRVLAALNKTLDAVNRLED